MGGLFFTLRDGGWSSYFCLHRCPRAATHEGEDEEGEHTTSRTATPHATNNTNNFAPSLWPIHERMRWACNWHWNAIDGELDALCDTLLQGLIVSVCLVSVHLFPFHDTILYETGAANGRNNRNLFDLPTMQSIHSLEYKPTAITSKSLVHCLLSYFNVLLLCYFTYLLFLAMINVYFQHEGGNFGRACSFILYCCTL